MTVRNRQREARRQAREAVSGQEAKRKAKVKRIEDLAVQILVALDAASEQERRAASGLLALIEEEGLSLREAVEWCGDSVSLRTATRLKSLAVRGASGCGLTTPDGAS